MKLTCDRPNSKKRPHPRALRPLNGPLASSEARLLTDNDTPFNIFTSQLKMPCSAASEPYPMAGIKLKRLAIKKAQNPC
jgi:hypothetical protein